MKLAINTAFALLALFGSSSASALPVDERSSNATSLEERAPCALHAIWESNWSSGAYRRYRVRGRAEGTFNGVNNYEMVRQWCRFFHAHASDESNSDKPELQNPQCSPGDGQDWAWADVSTFEGSNGHQIYVNHNQAVVNSWREWTGYRCDVNSSF